MEWIALALVVAVLAFALFAAVESGLFWFALEDVYEKESRTGVEGMVGLRGEVVREFEEGANGVATGKIRVRGELWSAKNGQYGVKLVSGDTVEVTAVRGLQLVVRKVVRVQGGCSDADG